MAVYVTQETQHDFTKAEEYGDIEFITKDDFSNVKNSLINTALVTEIKHKLKKFDESQDWIIITGSPYVSAAVFMELGNRGIRAVNCLRWDNRNNIYAPMTINLMLTRQIIQ